MARSSCEVAHPRVGRLGRVVAVVCFVHCALFLLLLLAFTLGVLPGAESWLPLFDNPMLHLVFGGTAVSLIALHLFLHRDSCSRKALTVAMLGTLCIGGSVVGEYSLHAHGHKEHRAGTAQHHVHGPECDHDEHQHHQPSSSTEEEGSVSGSCLSDHRSQHVWLHVLFMVGNLCLFLVHGLVRCKPMQ